MLCHRHTWAVHLTVKVGKLRKGSQQDVHAFLLLQTSNEAKEGYGWVHLRDCPFMKQERHQYSTHCGALSGLRSGSPPTVAGWDCQSEVLDAGRWGAQNDCSHVVVSN